MTVDLIPDQPRANALDPLGIPLVGLHLIEASAGTGKTYAIAHLVLRLLLESGRRVDEILVLTFTEAATEELKGRIARRLREARALLANGCAPVAATDPLLAATLARLSDPELALARLDAALANLDRAAIRTIHGFCQRILKDFAFESGAPFDSELIADEQDLRRAAVEDYWRRRIAAADMDEVSWLLSELPNGPQSLLDRLGGHLGGAAPRLLPEGGGDRSRAGSALAELHRELARLWPDVRAEVADLLGTSPALKRNIYSPGAVAEALAGMDAYCAGPPLGAPPGRLALFTPEKLVSSSKKGGTTPEHAFFEVCARLAAIDFAGIARTRRAELLLDAYRFLREELKRRKAERRVVYYDDLLSRTAAALDGPRGRALAERVRTAHPQALIDEFQDTDDLQYRIFRRLYADALTRTDGGEGGRRRELGLFLIGDPKQAIYGFRGADIFSYIAARRQAQTQGRIHTLDTNRRSASALVRAVNRVFGGVRAPFVFEPDIRFEPVQPSPDSDREPLAIDGVPAVPLLFRWLPLTAESATRSGSRIVTEAARALAVGDCARQIAALLDGSARIGDAALRAGDIAVLVRTHRDGVQVRDALGGLGIGCVSIGQDTVFDADEAEDLGVLFAALAPGAGGDRLRAALATRLLGWTAGELAGLASDEGAWDSVQARFEGYRETWRTRGFMAALDSLIHGEGVPERLRRGPEGERRLTNLMHLGELAQAASREQGGERSGAEGLSRWLAERRQPGSAEARGGEAALLRLESDEDLVRIVTFHKSKGLEYPVVFLPLPWSKGLAPDNRAPIAFHDRHGLDACLDLGSPDQDLHRALWAEEDLAERLRLFYVAVTRAKHRCVIYWGAVNQSEGSAAAYLLHQGPAGEPAAVRMGGLDEPALRSDLDALARDLPDAIRVEDLTPQGPQAVARSAPSSPEFKAAVFAGTIPDDWRLLSFSGLAKGSAGVREPERPDYDALPIEPQGGPALALLQESFVPPLPSAAQVEPVFRFPRGARAGHCLHDLFEHLDFRTAEGPVLRQAAESALARHGIEAHWTETLMELATRVLDTPLGPDGLRLRGIGPEDRRNELEFHFALGGFDPSALNRVLAAHGVPAGDLGSRPAPARLQGLMKGFVDLVVRRDGRYYILDYKSNHLGDSLDDYGAEGIARAMAQHGYHLQYLIYTVALHRYLRTRLTGYDPERHLGGVRYLFLRGMRPEEGDRRGVFQTRPGLGLILELERVFGDSAAVRGGMGLASAG
jgi:exodeoxyribonuclease V beta subunit